MNEEDKMEHSVTRTEPDDLVIHTVSHHSGVGFKEFSDLSIVETKDSFCRLSPSRAYELSMMVYH